MSSTEENSIPKKIYGAARILRAAKFSYDGFKVMLQEPAFRQELVLFVLLTPLALFIEVSIIEKILLIFSTFFILIVEVLNTSIEAIVDLASPNYHELAKNAKDTASLAVLMSVIFSFVVWTLILVTNYIL